MNCKAIVIGMILLLSCNKKTKYLQETEAFSKYLQEIHKESISTSPTYYFLFSETGCSGCIKTVLTHYNTMPNAVFILSSKTKKKFSKYIQVKSALLLEDKTDKIDRLSFHKGNVGIIKVLNGTIDTIITIDPAMLEDQLTGIK